MLGSLQREIDRLFDDFSPGFFGRDGGFFGRDRGVEPVKARMDLAETKDGFELTVELPGLDEKEVDLAIADGVLTVSGEKSFGAEDNNRNYHFVERGYGAFSRSIALPDGVIAANIKATMNKGVLTVAIPAPPKVTPQKVAVHAA
jgi:HSP20 family protein